MKKIIIFLMLTVFMQAGNVFAAQPTFLQYFFSVKKVLPDTKTIGIFLPESEFADQKAKIAKASKLTGIKSKIFLIDDMKSIGQSIQSLSGLDLLLVYDSPLLMKKTSRMFILSKCKAKNIPIITASEKYSKSGAFLGLLKGEKGHTKMVLNLKLTPQLASLFTEDYLKKTGIKEQIK